MCAHSVDDGLETGILQLLCGAGLTHAQVHTSVADRVDQVLCGAAHLLLAGRYAGNVQLAAQSGGLFKQGHVMAAQRCHTGGFQTGRAAAEDGDLLFLRCGLDAAGVLVAVLRVQDAGEELTVLDGIGAALVAADAAADIAGLPGSDLGAPVGVCQQRATHGNDVGHAALDDTRGHFGIHDTTHGADRHMDGLFDVPGDFDKEAVGLYAHGRNGVGHVAGVVGLRNVEHIHAVLYQPLGKLHGVGFVNAALAALRGDDGQLVVDDHIRHSLADGAGQHTGKADAVLQTAAELIGAVVHAGGAQAAVQAVAVDLDDVHTGLLCTHCAGAHLIDDGHQHLLADLIGEEHHVVMQALTHLIKLFLHKQTVDGVYVVLRVEELDAQLGAVGVYTVGQCLEGRDLAVVKQLGGGRKAVDGCHIAQNDVTHTALCQTGVEAHVLLADHAVFLVAGGQRGEHDAVFKGLSAHLDGLQNHVLHTKSSLQIRFALQICFDECCGLFLHGGTGCQRGKVVAAACNGVHIGCGVHLCVTVAGALVHQTVIVGAQQQHRAVVALGLGKGVGVLCHLVVKGHLVAQPLHVGVVLAGLHNAVGALGAAEPHPGARAQQNQAVGLDDRCAGGGNVAAHALAGEEQLFAVHIGLFSGPCKDILCIGVQAVKAHILELAVALAVAVEIEPGAADALRCQSAGQMGVHGLVAAAAAGKAVQMHHKGYFALGVGQGHDAAQGVAIAVFKLNL